MKFEHMVKHNGIYYPAGEDVPMENDKGGGESPAPLSSGKVEAKVVIKEEPVLPKEDDGRKYSEDDLQVGYMKLKAMCKREGLVVHPEYKSKDLKEMLRKL